MALPGFGIVQVPALEEGLRGGSEIHSSSKWVAENEGSISPREWLSPEEVPFSADLTQSYRAMSPGHW